VTALDTAVITRFARTPASAAGASSHPRPRHVRGAIWQAGVTEGNERRKVLFNGEPLPACFAAGKGWVLCHPEPSLMPTRSSPRAPLGLAYLIDEFRDKVLLTGRVEIVRGDRC
jgi:hypothetical protein